MKPSASMCASVASEARRPFRARSPDQGMLVGRSQPIRDKEGAFLISGQADGVDS
jgi:hypothetical protein